jgi:hypothetical protein
MHRQMTRRTGAGAAGLGLGLSSTKAAEEITWISDDPHLSGNFAPVGQEVDAADLPVIAGATVAAHREVFRSLFAEAPGAGNVARDGPVRDFRVGSSASDVRAWSGAPQLLTEWCSAAKRCCVPTAGSAIKARRRHDA